MWIGVLLLAVGATLGIYSWPALMAYWAERNAPPPPVDEFGRPERLTVAEETPAPINDPCRPVPFAQGQAEERLSLHRLIGRVEELQALDDPAVWPDPTRAAAALAEARRLLDLGEADSELAAMTGLGGAAVDATCNEAVDRLAEAHQRGARSSDVRCGVARAIQIRSRATQHRYFREGSVAAARWANLALEDEPKKREARVLLTRAQVAMGNLDAARVGLIALLRPAPDDPEARRSRSRWLLANGDRRGAVDSILPLIERLSPDLTATELLRIGPLLLQERKWRDAAEAYSRLLDWRSDRGEIWAGQARCLLEAKDYQAAAAAARRAVELLPGGETRELYREIVVRSGGTVS